ncbi:FU domain-containing protein T48 [Oratosquilla oratoria]|uniref:FU domain-containing protein T48 n=1 Tax=Oratosquilla oratoria TaxID=337810 RepID=UPI003F777E16
MTARVTRNVLVSVAASCVFLCCSASSAGTRNGSLQDSTCNQADCLRCDLDTAECLKCLYVMMEDDRTCLEACPEGFSTTWSYSNNYVGRVCTARSLLSFITGRDVAIIAGAAVGGAICVGVVIGALLYMRRRTKQAAVVDSGRTSRAPRIWKDKRVSATEVEVDEVERSAFLEQLSSLEGEAHNFLEMLNETRNRFRKLGGADSTTDTKAKAYRAVLRDLSRVLSLLNRSEYHLRTVPADWRRLVAWATRVLARYKRQKAAREAGEIPSIEPLSSASGGTLYQTRRQIQEERRRQAATQALSCCLHGRCQGADRPHGAAVHDVGTGAVGAGFSGTYGWREKSQNHACHPH